MDIVLAITIGVLVGSGIYMIQRRSFVKLILGIAMLGHAVNLMIFTLGRVTRGVPPIIHGEHGLPAGAADPLPQALILTAIVIGFGVQAFAIILIKRVYKTVHTDNIDTLVNTDFE